MKLTRMISAAALILLFAANVSAGEHKGKKGHMPAFSDFDLDGDGAITEQEFNEGHSWGNWRAHVDDMLVFFWGRRGER